MKSPLGGASPQLPASRIPLRHGLILLTAVALVACGGGQGGKASTSQSGALHTPDRGSSVAGTDADGDGVRDDVAAYVRAHYQGTQQAAALQLARGLQAALLVNVQDVTAAKAVSRRVSHGIKCIFSRFPGGAASKEPGAIVTELESVTTNTKPRLLAYLQYNKALEGTTSTWPTGETCE